MKETELRSGNWIITKSDAPFVQNYIMQVDARAIANYSKHYNGIILTAELLLINGFYNNSLPERYADMGTTNCLTFDKFSLSVEDDKWYPVRKYDNIQHVAYGIGIKYVHELQNLFYILKGDELNFKFPS